MGPGSIVVGIVAFLFMIGGFLATPVPYLGSLLSFAAPILALAGIIMGGVAMSRAKQTGESSGAGVAGLIVNIIAFVLSLVVALTCGLCNACVTGGANNARRAALQGLQNANDASGMTLESFVSQVQGNCSRYDAAPNDIQKSQIFNENQSLIRNQRLSFQGTLGALETNQGGSMATVRVDGGGAHFTERNIMNGLPLYTAVSNMSVGDCVQTSLRITQPNSLVERSKVCDLDYVVDFEAITACTGAAVAPTTPTAPANPGSSLQQLGAEMSRLSLVFVVGGVRMSCAMDSSGAGTARYFHPDVAAQYTATACQLDSDRVADAFSRGCDQGATPCSDVQVLAGTEDASRASALGLDLNRCFRYTSGQAKLIACTVDEGMKIIHLENPSAVQ